MSNEMLKKRKELKSRKPNFLRQDIHKKKKLKPNWRRPRGLHSKIRLNIKGYRTGISSGYSSPKLVRGLHPSGLKEVLISNKSELNKINLKEEGIIISSSVGLLKKYDIVKKAIELKIQILNIKDPSKYVSEFEALIESKKQTKSKKVSEKESKRKELEKLAEKKEKEKEKESKSSDSDKIEDIIDDSKEKDKNLENKKELDKILTKKENN